MYPDVSLVYVLMLFLLAVYKDGRMQLLPFLPSPAPTLPYAPVDVRD